MKEHLIRNSVRITSWNQMREEILEITRTQQYIDSQPMPMQLGANPKSKGKGKEGKGKDKGKGKDVKGKRQGHACEERIVQESKERRSEKVLLYCNKTGHVRAECRKRTERPCRGRGETGGSVATSTSTQQRSCRCSVYSYARGHSSTFVIAMPCANSETSCEFSSEEAVRSPGAGSFAPAETQRVRTIAAIPSNETYLMMDTCAGASIFPRGRRWRQ